MQETFVRSLGQEETFMEGHGNLLRYSCLDPTDRRAWRATVYGLQESDTTGQLSTNYHYAYVLGGLSQPLLQLEDSDRFPRSQTQR